MFASNTSKCKISSKNRCLIKPLLKKKRNSTQTIFQGSTPWVTQILNNVIVWMVLYCAHKLLRWKRNTTLCQPSLSKAGPLTFPWYFYWIAIWFTMDFYEVSMRCLWYFHEFTMGFLLDSVWDSHDISMLFLWESYVILIGFPWRFFGNSIAFQRDVYGISIGFLWDLYGILYAISKGFLWDWYGI